MRDGGRRETRRITENEEGGNGIESGNCKDTGGMWYEGVQAGWRS